MLVLDKFFVKYDGEWECQIDSSPEETTFKKPSLYRVNIRSNKGVNLKSLSVNFKSFFVKASQKFLSKEHKKRKSLP